MLKNENTRAATTKRRRAVPSIERLMTRGPVVVTADTPVAWAHDLMRKHDIRHLPVIRNERVVGVVSLGDLQLHETLTRNEGDDTLVEDIMNVVELARPEENLGDVAAVMAAKKLSVVVVVDSEQRPLGLFTTVDALRALLDASRG